MPDGSTQTLAVSGSNTVAVYFEGATEGSANDSDGDGLDDVQTRMVGLNLEGMSPAHGLVRVGLNPNFVSWGAMEETTNYTAGVLDLAPFATQGTASSFCDLFFRVEVGGTVLYTVVPKRMSICVITHKPPGPLDFYENLEDIPLVPAQGQPTGYYLSAARHRPQPPVEIDTFAFSIGQLELVGPQGTEIIAMTVPGNFKNGKDRTPQSP